MHIVLKKHKNAKNKMHKNAKNKRHMNAPLMTDHLWKNGRKNPLKIKQNEKTL